MNSTIEKYFNEENLKLAYYRVVCWPERLVKDRFLIDSCNRVYNNYYIMTVQLTIIRGGMIEFARTGIYPEYLLYCFSNSLKNRYDIFYLINQ